MCRRNSCGIPVYLQGGAPLNYASERVTIAKIKKIRLGSWYISFIDVHSGQQVVTPGAPPCIPSHHLVSFFSLSMGPSGFPAHLLASVVHTVWMPPCTFDQTCQQFESFPNSQASFSMSFDHDFPMTNCQKNPGDFPVTPSWRGLMSFMPCSTAL